MMHFEKTTIWPRAVELADCCYRLTSLLPPSETYGLSSQIRRASVSVYANFVEGWNRETKKDSANFLSISRASLAELKAHLLFCVKRRWLQPDDVRWALQEIDELYRIMTAIRLKLMRAN